MNASISRIFLYLTLFLVGSLTLPAQTKESTRDSTKKIRAEIKTIKSDYDKEVKRFNELTQRFESWKQNLIFTNKWSARELDNEFLDSLNIAYRKQIKDKKIRTDSVQKIVDSIRLYNEEITKAHNTIAEARKFLAGNQDSLNRLNRRLFDLNEEYGYYKKAIGQSASVGATESIGIDEILKKVRTENPYLKSIEEIFRTQFKESLNGFDALIKKDADKLTSREVVAAYKSLQQILDTYGFSPDDGLLLEYTLKLENLVRYTYYMDTARLYFSQVYSGALRKRLIELRANILDANTGGWISKSATDTLNIYHSAMNGYCRLTNEIRNDFLLKVPETFKVKKFTRENVYKEESVGYTWISPYLSGIIRDFTSDYLLSPSQGTIDRYVRKLELKGEDCYSYLDKK